MKTNEAIEQAAKICDAEADRHDARMCKLEKRMAKARASDTGFNTIGLGKPTLSMRDVAKKIRELKLQLKETK